MLLLEQAPRRLAFENRLKLHDCFEHTLPPQLIEQVVLPRELQPLNRDSVLDFWLRLLKRRASGEATSIVQFYLHVPFCRTKCRFCQFPSEPLRELAQLERFVVAIEEESTAFAASLGPVPVDCLAIGGGTPSLLSAPQLVRVLQAIRTLVRAPAGAYFSVECNPDSTTSALVDVLADYEVTRVSLGIQSFDSQVLRQVGRGYQTTAQVFAAVAAVRKRGLAVSVDLIAPLPGETATSFAAGVDYAIDLSPDMIVLYWFQPPRAEAQNLANNILSLNEARDILLAAASAAGYQVLPQSGPSLVVRRIDVPEPAIRYQQHRAERSSTFGFGPYAWSNIAGVGTYVTTGGADGRLTYRGVDLDGSREARSAIVRQFEAGSSIDRSAFCGTFGHDPVEMLPAEIAYLAEVGRVTVTDGVIQPNFSDRRDASRHGWVLLDASFLAAALSEATFSQCRSMAAAIALYEKMAGGTSRPGVRALWQHLQGTIAPADAIVLAWHGPAQTGPTLEVWLEPLDLEPTDRARALMHLQMAVLDPALQPIASVVSRFDAEQGLARIGLDVNADTGDSISVRLRFAAAPSRWLGLIDEALHLQPLVGVSPELASRMAELRVSIGLQGAIRRESVFLLNTNHACLRATADRGSTRILAELAEAGALVSLLRSDDSVALETDVPASATSVLQRVLRSRGINTSCLCMDAREHRLRIPIARGLPNWYSVAVAVIA